MRESGAASEGASFLNKNGGYPSGPHDFPALSRLMAIATLNGVKAMLSMNTLSGTALTIDGFNPLSCVQTELKCVQHVGSLLVIRHSVAGLLIT